MQKPVDIIFDGSWPGLLTVIFDVFDYKLLPLSVSAENSQEALFQARHTVVTDLAKAERVHGGLVKKVEKNGVTELWHTYLSELPEAPLLIVQVAMYYFNAVAGVQANFAHSVVIQIKKIVKSVSRERHRMKAFTRFQLLKDGLYFALIEPDFNVLPLIQKHFKDRYADQRWVIYDVKRQYGISYDLQQVTEVTFSHVEGLDNQQLLDFHSEEESLYVDLWKRYFQAVNITERKNLKLHIQHVPRRYWRYLQEKSFGRTTE
ncbi:TIGR03915 family putative DNA repair protein [Sphingobacterium oryzagri]|uniref:TIGR03915 family putative DNA repair protein n=1 Tax=Sphingobacterium oryzagri TaxID=3025669 RepID=A0ABY7WME9_9SPHI|nr:TIGR03915 family putative DNA repair protein [Sphingobacterium sp. KACC 22765]WDF70758.1 TIGR03915 family putative DNA repair protein [Sphingobacterium sp. KACC 22765]